MSTDSESTEGNDHGPGDAYQRYLDGDLDGAISIARAGLKRDQGDGNRIGEARNWLFIGLLQYHLGRMEESSVSMASALVAFIACGDQSDIGRCHRWLGRISVNKGEIETAERHFRTCVVGICRHWRPRFYRRCQP